MGLFEVFSGLLAAFYAILPSFGLSIILLTVAVRIVLLPLSIKQTRSMREMQRIQPEVKKLQAKYKGNRQKLNEEMMKLYKEHNVNPFGGCLPLLMQFPVLIGLFYVIRAPLKYMGYMLGASSAASTASPVENVSGLLQTIQQSRLADVLRVHFPVGSGVVLADHERVDDRPAATDAQGGPGGGASEEIRYGQGQG